jgi:putative addiction module killer protein
MGVVIVHEYLDAAGRSPFARWFERLNAVAAAKVSTAIYRLGEGNFSNVKGVGAGVFETRIDFGPGYRVYFGKDGDTVIVLLGGSVKKDQADAIVRAIRTWTAYKASKRLLRKG